jgi:hypothetical protein
VLVLASPELAGARGMQGGGWGSAPGFPGKAVPPVPGRAVPLPVPAPPVVLPANPGGVIQIQIQPGGIQVAPALPPLPANPAPTAPAPAPGK